MIKVLGRCSPRISYDIACAMGSIVQPFNTQIKRVIRKNIDLCYPSLSIDQRKLLTRKTLIETFLCPFEMARAWGCPIQENVDTIQHITGFDAIKTCADQKKGLILICPHLGNWELVNLFLATQLDISILYRPPKQRWLEAPIKNARERSGTIMAPANSEGVRHLFRTLKEGGAVGFLPDQDPGPNGGLMSTFFGIPANTMTLVSKLAAKSGAPVFCIYALRSEDHTGYRIECIELPNAIHSTDLSVSTQCLNQTLETVISKAPEQYQWSYKRFKHSQLGPIYEPNKKD